MACILLLLTATWMVAGEAYTQDLPRPELQAGLVDELELLYPDSDAALAASRLHSDLPRGSLAAVHLWVRGLRPGRVEMRVLPADASPPPKWQLYRLIDVPVEENTGLGSRTEQFEGKINPHVVRRAPFRVYEALQPVAIEELRAQGEVLALRLEYPLRSDAVPGQQEWKIEIAQGGVTRVLDWSVQVHAAVVPSISAHTLHYTNWFSSKAIASRHGLELWSEEHWQMLAQYARMMARGRQNTFWLRWQDVFTVDADGTPVLERARLFRYLRTFFDAGLYWIEGAPIAHRPGGDWGSAWLELGITGLPATSEEGRAALAGMAGQLDQVLRECGWKERWLQHIADEPTDTNAADYRKLSAHLREVLPGIPIVEATMTRELAGALDVWCPQVHKFQQNQAFFRARQAAGDRVWFYTCLVPGGPWLNRLLDQERLRMVWIGWAAAHYRLDGFLHWGLNHYKADPFEHSVVDHPAQPNTKNKLPAGDSHILYPGSDGPWSSQRFEAHRIGMEDRELLLQLQQRDPEAAAAIIASVFRACDDYALRVADYRTARRLLLEKLQ